VKNIILDKEKITRGEIGELRMARNIKHFHSVCDAHLCGYCYSNKVHSPIAGATKSHSLATEKNSWTSSSQW